MKQAGNRLGQLLLAIAGLCPAGCSGISSGQQSLPYQPYVSVQAVHANIRQASSVPNRVNLGLPVVQAVFTQTEMPQASQGPTTQAQAGELSMEALIAQVLERNPSLAQMQAAWQAAAAKYPQVTSLDDPTFAGTLGPASFGSNTVDSAYRLELSQKYPFPGKLGLRGQGALAEGAAASNDVEDMRLQLIESSQSAFYDYYLAARMLGVNAEGLKLLESSRDNAEGRYRQGVGPQADWLLVEVEIGKQKERRILLERMYKVAQARLNTLMHLAPDAPLPSPPTALSVPGMAGDTASLRDIALARRPDVQALMNRVAVEEAAWALACKEFYPDFEPFLMYDRFMGNTSDTRDLAWMAGVKLNLPVRINRRIGAVSEAQAKVALRRAELARLTDQINYDIQQAFEQVRESEKVVRLYQQDVLPNARLNVKTALAEYAANKVAFLSLIEAQRNLVNLEERFYEATADYFRRQATLERAIGGPMGPRR